MASAARSNGRRAEMCGLSLPAAIMPRSCCKRRMRMRGIAGEITSPKDTHDLAPLEQGKVQRDARNVSRRKADHEIASVPVHRPQSGFGVVATDRIVQHIGARAARQPLYFVCEGLLLLLRKLFRRIDETIVRAALFRERQFGPFEAPAITRAPIAWPISTAARPTPPAAPSTTSISRLFQLRPIFQRMPRSAVGDEEGRRDIEPEIAGHQYSARRRSVLLPRIHRCRSRR